MKQGTTIITSNDYIIIIILREFGNIFIGWDGYLVKEKARGKKTGIIPTTTTINTTNINTSNSIK